LSEACHDVSTEPSLQSLSGESLSLASANTEPGARLDIKASGFWGCQYLSTFFDVRIFNPFAPSNRSNPYCQHEATKRHQYEEHVREIEHGSFSPLIFSALGGMSASTAVVYKHLAFLLSTKWKTLTLMSFVGYIVASVFPFCILPSYASKAPVPPVVTLPRALYYLLLTLCLRRDGLGQHRPFFPFYSSL